MAVLTPYKGLDVVEGASGAGGAALTDNFKELADRAPYEAASDPGVNDDSGDGFAGGDRWLNTSTQTMWACISASPGAAVWKSIYVRTSTQLELIPEESGELVAINGDLITSSSAAAPAGSGGLQVNKFTVTRSGHSGGVTDMRAFTVDSNFTGSNAGNQAAAVLPNAVHTGSGTLSTVSGVFASARVTSTGSATNANVYTTAMILTSSGNVTSGRQFFAKSPSLTSTGTIGTCYGLYIERQKLASGVTTGYGVYQADTNDVNYFAGNVGIGTAPTTDGLRILTAATPLSLLRYGANESTILFGNITNGTSGQLRATDGLNAGLRITNSTATTDYCAFSSVGVTVPDGLAIVAGTTSGLKVATSTSQKLGFHNATPTVQRAGAAQAAVATTAATNSSPWGFTTQAQADAIVTLVNEIRATLVEKGLLKGSA